MPICDLIAVAGRYSSTNSGQASPKRFDKLTVLNEVEGQIRITKKTKFKTSNEYLSRAGGILLVFGDNSEDNIAGSGH